MNTIIKFRAWHKDENVLCAITTLTEKGAFLVGVKRGKDQVYDRMVVYAPDEGRFCKHEEIILMQYTGFLDRNGVEIYDGDIIKYDIDDPISHHRIFYDRKEARWFDDRLEDGDSATNYYDFDFVTEGVVIGNIYENPEMLQQFKYKAQ